MGVIVHDCNPLVHAVLCQFAGDSPTQVCACIEFLKPGVICKLAKEKEMHALAVCGDSCRWHTWQHSRSPSAATLPHGQRPLGDIQSLPTVHMHPGMA